MANFATAGKAAGWAVGALLAATLASAATGKKGWRLRMELVSEVAAVQPGEPFTVALRLEHEAGWHTYWRNPGIVGVPTSLEWELPEGFTAGPIQWPPPTIVPMATVKAYGYEKETFLLVEVTPPRDFEEKEIRLAAEAVYMACATTCHPGFEKLELRLPVAAEGDRGAKPDWDPRWRAAFEATRASFPVDLAGWRASVARVGDEIRLRLEPEAEGAAQPNRELREAYFFSTDGQVNSDKPQRVRLLEGGGIELDLASSFYGPEDAKTFEGVLYAEAGWLAGGSAKAMRLNLAWSGAGAD